ncbi:unnamed protein product [Brassicogethes aeneus]|uniref:DUF4806 domain-containing protein n=1 Tax=Brassicogethes aeneus TaxID=1431903 RepID=A0A9P0B016_BRAAE|nr:unnamed protein product [Brassicogethes aeneus]
MKVRPVKHECPKWRPSKNRLQITRDYRRKRLAAFKQNTAKENAQSPHKKIKNVAQANRDKTLLPVKGIEINPLLNSDVNDISIDRLEGISELPTFSHQETNIHQISSNYIKSKESYQNFLAKEMLKAKMSHVQVKCVLRIMRMHECLKYLPADSRTLLGTPRVSPNIYLVLPGEYLHIGVEKALKISLSSYEVDNISETLLVDIHLDGAQVHKVGTEKIWPIQCRISNLPKSQPEPIGIYKGNHNPESSEDYFKFLIQDINEIEEKGGIVFKDKLFSVKLRCLIADAPARAFILNHAGHNSLVPCSKCKIVGKRVGYYTVLKGTNHPPRTHDEYTSRVDQNHHHLGTSPISKLPFNMVESVVFDYMHLACLGIMKKLLETWVLGKYTKITHLTENEKKIVNKRLEAISTFCPKEFSHRPKTLTKFSTLFKATDYRQIALYSGPVIFKGILKNFAYQHFLLFHVAMRILVSSNSNKILQNFAETISKFFVTNCEEIYGPIFLSYNIHGFLHLTDDVRRFGPLDSFSAFPYENKMRYFTSMCRRPGVTLEQMANRRAEHENHNVNFAEKLTKATFIELKSRHSAGPVPESFNEYCQYKTLITQSYHFDCTKRNRCCILNDSTICLIYNILVKNSEYLLVVKTFKNICDFFDVGFPSSSFGVYLCGDITEDLSVISFTSVVGKCFLMPILDNNSRDSESEDSEADDLTINGRTREITKPERYATTEEESMPLKRKKKRILSDETLLKNSTNMMRSIKEIAKQQFPQNICPPSIGIPISLPEKSLNSAIAIAHPSLGPPPFPFSNIASSSCISMSSETSLTSARVNAHPYLGPPPLPLSNIAATTSSLSPSETSLTSAGLNAHPYLGPPPLPLNNIVATTSPLSPAFNFTDINNLLAPTDVTFASLSHDPSTFAEEQIIQIHALGNENSKRDERTENSDEHSEHIRNDKVVLNYLKREFRKIHVRMDSFERLLSRQMRRDMPRKPSILPFKSIENIINFTDQHDQFQSVIDYGAFIGGDTLKDQIHNLFKEFICDELCTQFTWWGDEQGIHPLYNSGIVRAIFGAVCTNKNFSPPTRVELQREVTASLKVAKQRHRNAAKRRDPTANDNDNEDSIRRRRIEADNLYNIN